MALPRAGCRPLILVLLATLLAGCLPSRQAPPGDGAGRLPVVSTVLPVTLFSRAVAAGCAEVTPLLPPGVGPHGFQARPTDPALLRRARVLVTNGLGMETFLDRLVAAAANPQLTILDSSRGVATLSYGNGNGNGDGDAGAAAGSSAGVGRGRRTADPLSLHGSSTDRDRTVSPDAPPAATPQPAPDAAVATAHGSGHAPHGREAHGEAHPHAHSGINPHIWLDPSRAAQQIATIRDGLIRADPACAATYRRNAAVAIDRLQQLDREFSRALQPQRGRTFVTLHAYAPYFAQRYGLRQAVLVASPEQPPSPQDLRRVAELVRRERLRALLSEPQQENRAFAALASDLGLPVLVFDPLETAAPAAPVQPGSSALDTYVQVMRTNVSALRRALGDPALSPPAARPPG